MPTDTSHENVENGGRPHYRMTPSDVEKLKAKYGFSVETLREFEEAFAVFDVNADGYITPDELSTVMVALGQRLSKQELEALLGGAKNNCNGSLDFDDFLAMMVKKLHVNPDTELREVFNVFDVDEDGQISVDELYDVLTRLGETISRDEVKEMIDEADTNNDGSVDFQEFKNILTAK